MPWLIVKDKSNRWCVFQKDASNKPVGESLGCHPSEEKALAQLGALYSNVREAIRFKGAPIIGDLLEDELRPRGSVWEIVIFRYGRSESEPFIVHNREAAERSIVVFDGAKVYANKIADHAGHKSNPNEKVTPDIIGLVTNPRATETDFRGTLNILPSGDWLRMNLLAARERGLPMPYELSIDAQGVATEDFVNGEMQLIAHHFDRATIDVVDKGAAGGGILRMVASKSLLLNSEGNNMKNKLLLLFSLLYPSFLESKKLDVAAIDENELFTHLLEADKPQPRLHIPDGMELKETWLDEKITKLRESLSQDMGAEFAKHLNTMLDKFGIENAEAKKKDEAEKAAQEAANNDNKIELDKELAAKLNPVEQKMAAIEAKMCTHMLSAKLTESKLPMPLQDDVRGQFQGKTFQESDLDGAITRTRKTHGKMEEFQVKNSGADIRITDEQVDKITRGLDGFFLCTNPMKPLSAQESKDILGGVPPYKSIKRVYQEFTGDWDITGKIKGVRASESLATGDWAQVVANAMNKRLVRDYNMMGLDTWRQFVDILPLGDFKQQSRIRTGGYANLPTRPQGAAYAPLSSPTDEEATYTPATRGGTEDVTRELIMNDDVGAVVKIPTRMARSAAQTLHEFVYEFINPATNANIYDGTALYTVGHANLGTTAIGTDGVALFAARLRMRKQTQAGSVKPLGIRTGLLVGPNDLEKDFYANLTPAFDKNNQVPEFMQAQGVTPKIVDYWTDATDWGLIARREDGVGLEIGFINGQETPETFVSDVANVGSWFTNDKITYKIRHEYGGAITDFRFFDGSQV